VGGAYLTQHSNTHLNLIAQKTPGFFISFYIQEEEKAAESSSGCALKSTFLQLAIHILARSTLLLFFSFYKLPPEQLFSNHFT
jgi:hypothetical protein